MQEANAGGLEEKTLRDYYDRIADDYDGSRFGNSYGRYIAAQERRILERWLPAAGGGARVLDLACGTGRFLDLATTGLDASGRMLRVAARSSRGKVLVQSNALSMPWRDGSFDAVFSLHLFMHLRPATVAGVLDECHRILKPGGVMVFDMPSATRRRMLGFRAQGWHGSTSESLAGLKSATLVETWRHAEGGLPAERVSCDLYPKLG